VGETMFRSVLAATLFSIAWVSCAFAEEIVVTGTGRVEGRAQRSIVTVLAPGGMSQPDQGASSLDALARLVRQADPSAREVEDDAGMRSPGFEFLGMVPHRSLEFATSRASGVSDALAGFQQSGVTIAYRAVPDDPVALRSAALRAAFADAHAQAALIAAATNLQLGAVVRIEQGSYTQTVEARAVATATNRFGRPPEIQASDTQTITVTFGATR
jgi:hypothetical protein